MLFPLASTGPHPDSLKHLPQSLNQGCGLWLAVESCDLTAGQRPVTEKGGDERMLLEHSFPEGLVGLRGRRWPGPGDRA